MMTFTTKSAFILPAVVSLFCIPAFGQVTKTEDQKLIPFDLDRWDNFGNSVAVDGDTAIIGAKFEDDGGTFNNGAVYVFTRSGGVWTEQVKLLASDKEDTSVFGQSVALDGDTAVIGANTAGGGAAYVFIRSGGVWSQQAKLLASDKDHNDWFGGSVALDGDTAVIGAENRSDGESRKNGAAYVFTRSGGVWTEQAKLLASDRDSYDFFGHSVALEGDSAVIGADFKSDGGTRENGAAYVFTRSGGVWTEQAKLLASDKDHYDRFGASVALDGDTAVVGADWVADGETIHVGAAYVFTRSGGAWTEQAKLLASDKDHYDRFGASVAVDGDTAIIGAGYSGDAAYVFTRSGGVWTEQAKLLASDKATKFGRSVALDGDTAVIGANQTACVYALTPVAVDDGPYVLDEGAELVEDVNILDNDADLDGDPLTPVVVDPPAHTSFFQVIPDGTFDYTHDGSETTSDSFTYRASDGANESEIATVLLEITPVNDAPRVQLIGQSTISIDRGAAYTDPGATAEDPEDGDISDAIVVGGDVVDTNVEGTYLITYNVVDSDGLAADGVIRTVIVTVDDPPVITLIGPATLSLQVGDTYNDQGATAVDPEDGDLTNAIVIDNPVDTSTPGTYTVTYTVEDSAGNQAQVERVVIVEAAPPPPPPRTDRGGGGGGGAVAPFEVLASILMLLAVCGSRRRSACGRSFPVER